VLEHEKEESTDADGLLPPKPETPNAIKTKRPVANQEERIFTPKPEFAKPQSNSAMVGRTFGSPTPAAVGGIAVGPAGPGVGTGLPGGSAYGRLIQQILSRNYNPPGLASARPEYVIIELHIARDGTILSVSGGRVMVKYFKRRSSVELVNNAAERAILVSKLPPFPPDFLTGHNEAAAEIWFKYPK
ncbi:MAG: TonB C-terminal domain-containing protein, partial [Blastocatellia bacterium]